MTDALSAAHRRPIVFVFCGTKQADLIKLSVGGAPWPRKLMRATAQEENIEQLLRHGSRLSPGNCTGKFIMHWNSEVR
jgi:hypothetical protein